MFAITLLVIGIVAAGLMYLFSTKPLTFNILAQSPTDNKVAAIASKGVVIQTSQQFQSFMDQYIKSIESTVPAVNFDKTTVIAAVGGSITYSIGMGGVLLTKFGYIKVPIVTKDCKSGSTPYSATQMIAIPKTTKNIHFTYESTKQACAPDLFAR